MIRNVVHRSSAMLFALALSGAVAGSAAAQPSPVSEHFAAQAGSQVADLSLLGRHSAFGSATTDSDLEAVGDRLSGSAVGLGTTLMGPATKSVARFGDAGAPGGTRCATPAVGPVLGQAAQKAPFALGVQLPAVTVSQTCSGSAFTGTPRAFTAAANGGPVQVAVKLPAALGSRARELAAGLAPKVLATPVGQLVSSAAQMAESKDAESKAAVAAVNGLLGTLVPGVTLPQVEPKQTVGSLIERVAAGDLLRVDLAGASARNAADAATYVAEALNQGGVIEVLPGFRGSDSAPLLRITVAASRAGVNVERATTTATPALTNTVVRIESELLGSLPVAGLPVVDGKVNGVPLSGVPGGNLPVVGGLLGGGLPLPQLTSGLGLRNGPNFVEVGPGQGVSLLCEGPVAPMCTEVSVGAATAPAVLPSGMTRVQASTATVHLFKGLDQLSPNLGTVLAGPDAARAIEPLAAPAGITLGEATEQGGIRLTLAGALAQAGGARVLGAEVTREAPVAETPASPAPAPAPALPRTGLPFDSRIVPLLFGSAGGLGLVAWRIRSRA